MRLHDEVAIERFLRRNIYLHLYAIGDLDDFYRPYTTWYGTVRGKEICEIALLYTGHGAPALLALSEDVEGMGRLLESILHLLPRRFSAHLSPGVETVFAGTHRLDSHGEHLKMVLREGDAVANCACPDACGLGPEHAEDLTAFYRRCYPENSFDPRMLETRRYYGIRKDGRIVSAAGIHVYSKRYAVAALGNVATEPEHRNKGYGRQVTAGTCRSLLGEVRHIGLNVKADNDAAIACYRGLGFEPVASYGEYAVHAV